MVTAQADPEMWDIDRGRARARPIIAGVQGYLQLGFAKIAAAFARRGFGAFAALL